MSIKLWFTYLFIFKLNKIKSVTVFIKYNQTRFNLIKNSVKLFHQLLRKICKFPKMELKVPFHSSLPKRANMIRQSDIHSFVLFLADFFFVRLKDTLQFIVYKLKQKKKIFKKQKKSGLSSHTSLMWICWIGYLNLGDGKYEKFTLQKWYRFNYYNDLTAGITKFYHRRNRDKIVNSGGIQSYTRLYNKI